MGEYQHLMNWSIHFFLNAQDHVNLLMCSLGASKMLSTNINTYFYVEITLERKKATKIHYTCNSLPPIISKAPRKWF